MATSHGTDQISARRDLSDNPGLVFRTSCPPSPSAGKHFHPAHRLRDSNMFSVPSGAMLVPVGSFCADESGLKQIDVPTAIHLASAVNRLANLTPHRRPVLTRLRDGLGGSARLVGTGRDCGDEASAGGVIVIAAFESPAVVAGLDDRGGRWSSLRR
jgi:hypothetical protein